MGPLSRNSRSKTKLGGVRALPWLMLGQAAMVLKDHWKSVSPTDRARLTELLKVSKGRPANLTPQQRQELKTILARLDLKGLGRDVAPIVGRSATRGRNPLRRG